MTLSLITTGSDLSYFTSTVAKQAMQQLVLPQPGCPSVRLSVILWLKKGKSWIKPPTITRL